VPRTCELFLGSHNKARADTAGGLVFHAGTLTLGEYLDRWLSDYPKPLVAARKMEHSTYVRYAGIVRNHVKPHLGHKRLKDLSRVEVRRLYSIKAEELSARSVDYIGGKEASSDRSKRS
jgi:hypothetical protein